MSRRMGAVIGSALAFYAVITLLGCVPVAQTRSDAASPSTADDGVQSGISRETGLDSTSSQDGSVRSSGRERNGYSTLSPAERRLREQSRKFDRTIWEGTLVGAAGGAVWGLIGGGDTSDMLRQAAIGAATGSLSGAYVARKQEQYADKEDQLQAMILDVRESNEDAEAFIESAREVVAEDKRRLAAVEKRYKQGTAAYAELQREKGRVGANRQVIVKAVDGAKQKYTMFKGAEQDYQKKNPDTDTQRLQRELKTYNEQIQTLDDLAESVSVA
jgi:hypothetical protein